MKQIFLSVLLVIFCILKAYASDSDVVLEIFNKVEKQYESLNSYSDFGYVKANVEINNFKTFYIKPNLFKIMWSSKILTEPPIIEHYIVWSDGQNSYSYHSLDNRIEKEENLSMAIAGATGISLGAAYNISAILNLAGGRKKTRIDDPVLIGEKLVEGDLCYHIKGRYKKSPTKFDVYISKTTYMIRKIVRHTKNGTIEAIYRQVTINPEIPISEFNLCRGKPAFDAYYLIQ